MHQMHKRHFESFKTMVENRSLATGGLFEDCHTVNTQAPASAEPPHPQCSQLSLTRRLDEINFELGVFDGILAEQHQRQGVPVQTQRLECRVWR
jgi:hypothetical protein